MTGPHLRNPAELTSGSLTRAAPASQPSATRHSSVWPWACFLAQWLAFALWVPPANVSTVWVPGGLLLAITLLTERRRWPSVITAGAVGVALLFGALRLVSPGGAMVLGTVTGLETFVGRVGPRRLIGPTLSLATRSEFLTYLAVVVVGGAIVVSTILLITVAGLKIRPTTFQFWRTFALAVALGYLTVTPAVVLLVRDPGSSRRAARADGWRSPCWRCCSCSSGPWFFRNGGPAGDVGRVRDSVPVAALVRPAVRRAGRERGAAARRGGLHRERQPGHGPLHRFFARRQHALAAALRPGYRGPAPGFGRGADGGAAGSRGSAVCRTRMRELNRKLIAAHEEEAARIARELHDDVGQRLALVSIGLGRLRQAAPETSVAAPIAKLQEQTGAIARALRRSPIAWTRRRWSTRASPPPSSSPARRSARPPVSG